MKKMMIALLMVLPLTATASGELKASGSTDALCLIELEGKIKKSLKTDSVFLADENDCTIDEAQDAANVRCMEDVPVYASEKEDSEFLGMITLISYKNGQAFCSFTKK